MVTSELSPSTSAGTHRGRHRGPLVVPATLVLCYVLATGRWGAYLGWTSKSVYVADIGLFLSAAWLLVVRRRSIHVTRSALMTLAPLLLFLAWAAGRWAVAPNVDRDALRDLAPYVYAAVALVALVPLGTASRRRTLVLVQVALVVHAVWVTLSFYVVDPLVEWSPLLGERVRFLEIRSDFDGALLSVLAAVGLRSVVAARSRWWQRLLGLCLAAWPAFMVLQLGNRAGLLALLAVLLLAVASESRFLLRLRPWHLGAGLVAVIALAAVVVPRSELYERLTGGEQYELNNPNGTILARKAAWEATVDYTTADPARFVAGVGFGPDFLADSGARPYFGGAYQDVRAAHSSVVNTYARVGLVGLLLLLGILVQWGRGCARVLAGLARHEQDDPSVDELGLTAVLVSTALLVASLVGVILESPFGAFPFYWAVGLLLLAGRREGARR